MKYINQNERVLIITIMAAGATFETAVRISKGQKLKSPWLTGLRSAVAVASIIYSTNNMIDQINIANTGKK